MLTSRADTNSLEHFRLLGDEFGSELHANFLGLMREQETLAEIAAVVTGIEQVGDLSVAGGNVDGKVDHWVFNLGTLFDGAHHHFHHGDYVQELLNLRGNLGGLAMEIFNLFLTLKEEALLSSTDEISAESGGRGGKQGNGESFHAFEKEILIIITS